MRAQQTSSWRPGLADVTFALFFVLVVAARHQALVASDGDLTHYLRVGSRIIAEHQIRTVDDLSFASSGQPFAPKEWLSAVVYAGALALAGLPGVVLVAAALIAAVHAGVVWFLQRRGVDPALALLVGAGGAFVAAFHWLARPHLFSWLGMLAVLVVMERADPRPTARSSTLVAIVFALWANLHGGFVYGLALIACYAAGDAVVALRAPDPVAAQAAIRRVIAHGVTGVVAALAVLVNPVGPWLYVHVWGFSQRGRMMDLVQEFQSPDFHQSNLRVFAAVLLGVFAAYAATGTRARPARLLVLVLMAGLSLYSVRNAAVFMLTGVPLAALDLDTTWRTVTEHSDVRPRLAAYAASARTGLASIVVCVVAILAVVVAPAWGAPHVLPTAFPASVFPVDAVAAARADGLTGRLYHTYIWGGYVAHAWPEQHIFVDGYLDAYDDEVVDAFARINGVDRGWQALFQQYGFTLALVPPSSRLTDALAREPGWTAWYCDGTAVLLRKNADQPARTPEACAAWRADLDRVPAPTPTQAG